MTFAEQADGLTARHGRRTPPLGRLLSANAVALAGRACEHLAARLPAPVSRMNLPALVMALPPRRNTALATRLLADHVHGQGMAGLPVNHL